MSSRDIVQAAAGVGVVGGGGGGNPNAYDFANYGYISTRTDSTAFNPRTIVTSGKGNWKDNLRAETFSAFSSYAGQFLHAPWAFNSSGTKALMYPYSNTSRWIIEASFSTAWDLSTISFTNYKDVSSYYNASDTTSSWGFWSKDGQNIYVFSQEYLYHFTLSTAFDTTSSISLTYSSSIASFLSQNGGTSSGLSNFGSGNVWIAGNGSTIYYSNGAYLYTMPLKSGGTAFDLNDYNWNGSTTGRVSISGLSGSNNTALSSRTSTHCSYDGTKVIISTNSSAGDGYAVGLSLSDPTDATTASIIEFVEDTNFAYFGESSGGVGGGNLMPFKTTHESPNGRDFMYTNYTSGMDWQCGTASAAAFSGSKNNHPYGTSTQESSLAGAQGFFVGNSGTKIYFTGSYERITQYNLPTAYEVASGPEFANWIYPTYNVSTEVGSSAYSLYFKSDGTKMYVLSAANYNIYQYSLSTAWDTSTLSYDSKSVNIGTYTFPAFCMSSDGNYIFTTTYTTRKIQRWTLSTAWDISTASIDSGHTLTQNVNTSACTGVDISRDGTKLYINVRQSHIECWTLSTAWDLTSGTFDGALYFNETNHRGPSWESILNHELRVDDTGERLYYSDWRSGRTVQITIDGS